jgi:hypothetical protein
VSGLTGPFWNDPEDQRAIEGVTPNSMGTRARMTARIRRTLRRVDDWTLTAFNPRYPTPSRER